MYSCYRYTFVFCKAEYVTNTRWIMSFKKEPLAFRMRPTKLEQFVGQEHILAEGKLLRRMIQSGHMHSVIFCGPPGTGKTTLAKIIAHSGSANFERLNAVTSGVNDIKRIVADTQNQMLNPEGKTVLFIDEIHRFNKQQQDALLPYVEDGTLTLIGATTENPYFEVNKALISRSTIFMFHPLEKNHIQCILQMAMNDKENGVGNLQVILTDDAKDFLSEAVNGDARVALQALEIAVRTTEIDQGGFITIDLPIIENCLQQKNIRFDASSEAHYDNISALIKSMRGSDPDATLFYLARALYAGEDPLFLARRIVICASEDVGLANPAALNLAVSAASAVHMIGMPEARIILAQAAVMVATSPKSNSTYTGINEALHDIKTKNTGEVPMHLRNAPVSGMKEQGYGKGYLYPHDYSDHYVRQEYLPIEMKGTKYYQPTNNGYESKILDWLERTTTSRDKKV